MVSISAFSLRLSSCRCSWQGRIADINVLGNQLEVVEGVGDPLLLRKHRVVDGLYSIAAPREGQLDGRLIETNLRRECGRGLLRIRLGPRVHRAHFVENDRHHIRPLRRIGPGSKKKLMIADYTGAIGKNASTSLPLSG